jgi:hypothetical protein
MIELLVPSVIATAAGLTTAAWNLLQILRRRELLKTAALGVVGVVQQLSAVNLVESSAAATVIQRAYRRHRKASFKYGAFEFALEDVCLP